MKLSRRRKYRMQQMNKRRIDLGHCDANISCALAIRLFFGISRTSFSATRQNNAFFLLLRMPVFAMAVAHRELRKVALLFGRLARSVCFCALAPRGAPRLLAPENDPQAIAVSTQAPLDTAAFRNILSCSYG
jgi:hypothetical protein